MIPDPERVPKRVADSLDMQVEFDDVANFGELATHLAGEDPFLWLHVTRVRNAEHGARGDELDFASLDLLENFW